MRSTAVTATRERLERLANSRLPWDQFAEETLEIVSHGIGFDAGVIAPMDRTGLVTGSIKRELPDDSYPHFARYEYVTPGPDTYTVLAQRPNPVAITADENHGDPRRNPRYDEFLAPALSIAHEVRAAAVHDGTLVGGISLFRTTGASAFDTDTADLLRALTPVLARGLRVGPGRAVGGPAASHAVLVVDHAGRVEARSAEARAWLAELDPSGVRPVPIPVVTVVASAQAHGSSEIQVPSARSGWVRVRGTVVRGQGGRDSTVVSIEPLRGHDAARLGVAAMGLTQRERDVVDLVLAGTSTTEIAARLHLSAYTVQDHLKSVFAKAGVRSRRELVASLQA